MKNKGFYCQLENLAEFRVSDSIQRVDKTHPYYHLSIAEGDREKDNRLFRAILTHKDLASALSKTVDYICRFFGDTLKQEMLLKAKRRENIDNAAKREALEVANSWLQFLDTDWKLSHGIEKRAKQKKQLISERPDLANLKFVVTVFVNNISCEGEIACDEYFVGNPRDLASEINKFVFSALKKSECYTSKSSINGELEHIDYRVNIATFAVQFDTQPRFSGNFGFYLNFDTLLLRYILKYPHA